jgi:hypothetical protein
MNSYCRSNPGHRLIDERPGDSPKGHGGDPWLRWKLTGAGQSGQSDDQIVLGFGPKWGGGNGDPHRGVHEWQR